MSWMQKALETYEQNGELAGKVREGESPLLPVSHLTLKAQLEITIDQDGTFIDAKEVDKQNCNTIIPVTEASGGRSSGTAPHPLNDNLGYIAADFAQYSGKKCGEKYTAYLEGLRQWAESDYSHPKVKAVYAYVKRGTVIQDLVQKSNIVTLTAQGRLDNKKIQGTEYEKVMVRFRVLDAANPQKTSATWEDKTLMDAYYAYLTATQTGETDICYLTGKKSVISSNHPKGVVPANYSAKLISANDKTNFTFRGRFTDASDACVISYEATQKAHAALTWLSRNQGVTVGNRTYIAWTVKGTEVKAFNSKFDLFRAKDETVTEPKTMPEYRARLRKAFQGYASALQDGRGNLESVYLIGLDAATTGRLSVTYYNEFSGSVFLDRLQYWETSCKWYQIDGKTGKTIIKTPSIPQIIKHAFGTEQDGLIKLDDSILKEQAERLMRCMVDQLPIPYDLVRALCRKASSPQCYEKWWNWEAVLTSACAVIAKYYCYDRYKYHTDQTKRLVLDQEGVDFDMTIDDAMKENRSYLFGKLLATLEKVEQDALWQKNEDRETNAIRLQSAFVSHPMTTWKTLEEALLPYYQQLHPAQTARYKKEIETITEQLMQTQMVQNDGWQTELNRPLDETYLLGYYLQRKALKERNSKSEETVSSN